MKLLKLSISFLLICIFSYSVSTAQETTLFAASAEDCDSNPPSPNSALYIVNPLNGNSTMVGPIGFNGVTGLAVLGDGRLVGTAQADIDQDRIAILIEINRNTGQGSLIGEIGNSSNPGECGRVPDITYSPATDTLYGIARRCQGLNNNQFIQINQATGEGTIIGDTGFDGGGNGLAINDDGTIFWGSNGVGLAILFTINPLNGLGTQISNFSQDFPQLGAFAFHPMTGTLFASNINPPDPLSFPNTSLETLNTANGLLTLVGQLPDCTDALIFAQPQPSNVPTLSEWGLIALAGILGIVGFMVMRRRKVTA